MFERNYSHICWEDLKLNKTSVINIPFDDVSSRIISVNLINSLCKCGIILKEKSEEHVIEIQPLQFWNGIGTNNFSVNKYAAFILTY